MRSRWLTVRALGEDGKIETQFCDPIGHVQVKGDYVESWQPQPMSDKVLARAKEIAEAVTGALGGRGCSASELFVKGQEVWFSEVSPRPHDTGMVTMATQAQNEFELHVRAILGLPVGTRMRRPGASAVIYGGRRGRGHSFRKTWTLHCACRSRSCACSASRWPTNAGAWAWRSPPPISRNRAQARQGMCRQGAAGALTAIYGGMKPLKPAVPTEPPTAPNRSRRAAVIAK